MVQHGAGSVPIGIPISCLKTVLPIVQKYLFLRKDIELTRVYLVNDPLPAALEVQEIDVLEKPMRFLTLDLMAKLITSESTFRRSLCGMVIYKVLKTKVEIDLAQMSKFAFWVVDWVLAIKSKQFRDFPESS